MRARTRVSEKCTDLIRRFRRKNMLKLASLLLNFRFAIHRQAVSKKSLGQTMTPDNIAGALPSTRREFDDQRAVSNRRGHGLQRIVAGIYERLMSMRHRRM